MQDTPASPATLHSQKEDKRKSASTAHILRMERAESLDGAASALANAAMRRPSDPLTAAAAQNSSVPLHVFDPVKTKFSAPSSHAMLLLPSDGGTEPTGLPPRPLSAADIHSASLLTRPDPRALTSGHTSPINLMRGSVSRSHSPYLPRRTRREDQDDASRVTLHGAAAGAHAAGDERTQLVVHNLPPHVRWQDVKDLFRRAGTVLRADVHPPSQDSRVGSCVGTVLFATQSDAHRAINTLHGYTWHGRILDVALDHELVTSDERVTGCLPSDGADTLGSRSSNLAHGAPSDETGTTDASSNHSRPSSDIWPATAPLPYPGRVLFVGNLPFHCQWQDLKDLFRAAGNIQRADVALNAEGRSRGFGTVLFASPEDAQTAVRLYHGYEYNGRTLKVHFDRHAHYGPSVPGIPTDPSQYTSAFQLAGPTMHASAPSAAPLPHGMHDSDAWGAPAPDLAQPTGVPHPGRIALPPLTLPPLTAMTPNVPLTPGMPSFLMRSVLETPPIYPYMMSPGVTFTPGVHPYLNATPGAPVDPSTGLATYAPPPGMGGFAPAGTGMTLPPTPHWSQQPMGPRARTGSVSRMTANRDALPPVGSQRTTVPPGEYPFPATDRVDNSDDVPQAVPTNEVPPTDAAAPSVLPSTRDLTNAIAKLSVRGTARAKRSPDDLSERAAAGEALLRLRRDLAAKDDARATHSHSDV